MNNNYQTAAEREKREGDDKMFKMNLEESLGGKSPKFG
jgi:hypothetical protein